MPETQCLAPKDMFGFLSLPSWPSPMPLRQAARLGQQYGTRSVRHNTNSTQGSHGALISLRHHECETETLSGITRRGDDAGGTRGPGMRQGAGKPTERIAHQHSLNEHRRQYLPSMALAFAPPPDQLTDPARAITRSAPAGPAAANAGTQREENDRVIDWRPCHLRKTTQVLQSISHLPVSTFPMQGVRSPW